MIKKMVKPLGEFGGWLRFFWVSAFLNMMVNVLGACTVFSLVLVDKDSRPLLMPAYEVVASLFFAWIMYLLVRVLKKKCSTSVDLVKRYCFIAIVFLFANSVTRGLMSDEDFFEAYRYPHSTLWLLFLILYFERSERVKSYFGRNLESTNQVSISEQESIRIASGFLVHAKVIVGTIFVITLVVWLVVIWASWIN